MNEQNVEAVVAGWLDAEKEFQEISLEGFDFCESYRKHIRKLLSLAILILSFTNPGISEALKKVRDELDDKCPV